MNNKTIAVASSLLLFSLPFTANALTKESIAGHNYVLQSVPVKADVEVPVPTLSELQDFYQTFYQAISQFAVKNSKTVHKQSKSTGDASDYNPLAVNYCFYSDGTWSSTDGLGGGWDVEGTQLVMSGNTDILGMSAALDVPNEDQFMVGDMQTWSTQDTSQDHVVKTVLLNYVDSSCEDPIVIDNTDAASSDAQPATSGN